MRTGGRGGGESLLVRCSRLTYCYERNSLAYLEMRMVLAKLFWKYDLAWFNGEEVDWERDTKGYTLW